MGLFIATPSYNGTISFSIISDRKMMPDIEFFRECLQRAFDELKDAKPGANAGQAKKAAAVPKKPPMPADGSVMYRRVAKKPRATGPGSIGGNRPNVK